MNVYISCGLTHVPRPRFKEYASFIHRLAQAVRSVGCGPVTYALVNSDPQLAEKPFQERARLCYLWDREFVEQSNLVIADASYPSIGMGVELQIAENMGIPVIICFKQVPENRVDQVEYENPDYNRHTLQIGEGYVSLMALGLPTVFKVIGYETDEKGISTVVETVQMVMKREARI